MKIERKGIKRRRKEKTDGMAVLEKSELDLYAHPPSPSLELTMWPEHSFCGGGPTLT